MGRRGGVGARRRASGGYDAWNPLGSGTGTLIVDPSTPPLQPSHGDPEEPRVDVTSSLTLLQRARAGDAEALNRLYERYLPRLRRWSSGRLPRWRRDLLETEDLVQETLLRTLERLEDFEPRHEGALQGYLRQAVLNRIRDEARKVQRRPTKVELQDDDPDAAASPIEEVVGHETLERYEAALARLKPVEREAIVARVEMGLEYAEIAEALGKPSAEAARVTCSRALARLAKEMGHAR